MQLQTALAETTETEIVTHPASDAGSLMQAITRAASDPNVDIDKMERLMAMHERMVAKGAEQAFVDAMNAAQAEMRPIAADADNPQTKSRYASYAALDRVLRPIYIKHGFSISFDEGDANQPDYVRVLCYVSHKAGHTRTYRKDMPADGKGAKGGDVMTKTHASGAADTYGMRYLLKKIFNVAVGEDDKDGNSSGAIISDEQLKRLQALASEVGGDVAKLCKHFGISALPDLPVAKLAEAVGIMELRRGKAATK
jgi:hypothetical protein